MRLENNLSLTSGVASLQVTSMVISPKGTGLKISPPGVCSILEGNLKLM